MTSSSSLATKIGYSWLCLSNHSFWDSKVLTSVSKVASSYKFCLIANGEFDIYAAKERANEWDYAAGHAVAQNAGAIIKTLDKKPFLYGKEDYKNPSLLIRRAEDLND